MLARRLHREVIKSKLHLEDDGEGEKLNVVSKSSPQKKSNEMMDIIRSSNNKRKVPSIKNPKQFVRVVYTDPHNTQNLISKYVNVDFINKNVGPGDYDIERSMNDAKGVT